MFLFSGNIVELLGGRLEHMRPLLKVSHMPFLLDPDVVDMAKTIKFEMFGRGWGGENDQSFPERFR